VAKLEEKNARGKRAPASSAGKTKKRRRILGSCEEKEGPGEKDVAGQRKGQDDNPGATGFHRRFEDRDKKRDENRDQREWGKTTWEPGGADQPRLDGGGKGQGRNLA